MEPQLPLPGGDRGEQLQAVYRDGVLTVTAPKANKVSTVTVTVKVEG